MSELSGALGGSAPKHPFMANGKAYQVGLVTQDVKIAFEKSLYAKAREALKVWKADLEADQFLTLVGKLSDAYEAGDFAMEGDKGKKAIQSPQGAVLILSLLMGVDSQEVVQCLLANEAELLTVFRTVMKESFPGVKFEEADPTAIVGGQPDPKS